VNDLTRRNFLTKVSLGVAGIAASSGLALPQLLTVAREAPEADQIAPDLAPIGEDLVAFIRNASSGEVAVMSGSREVIYHDPQLVGRLLDAARKLATKE
jgi:hypothetical protein